jgi:hypothetical protein
MRLAFSQTGGERKKPSAMRWAGINLADGQRGRTRWNLFSGVPVGIHLLEGGVLEGDAVLFEAFFDLVEAVEEFFVGSFEGDFGVGRVGV